MQSFERLQPFIETLFVVLHHIVGAGQLDKVWAVVAFKDHSQ